jgi:hypothetical protein
MVVQQSVTNEADMEATARQGDAPGTGRKGARAAAPPLDSQDKAYTNLVLFSLILGTSLEWVSGRQEGCGVQQQPTPCLTL